MARQSRYGSGSIRSKGEGRWELRVSAGRDPVTGRSRSVSRSVRRSKREAEAALAGLLVEVRQGTRRTADLTIIEKDTMTHQARQPATSAAPDGARVDGDAKTDGGIDAGLFP